MASKSRYMKIGNIADNRVGLAPNPEEKPKAVKKPSAKNAKATKPVSPKKPSPNKPAPKNKPNVSKKAKTPAKSAPAKSVPKKAQPNANTAKTNKNAPKYRFNSPSNSVLTANNFEDLYRLEGKGESREEFKRKM